MKKKFKKKLVLNKTTLANLNNEEMSPIYGGATLDSPCTPALETIKVLGCAGTLQRACDPGSVAVTCGCNTLTDCQ